MKSDSLIPTKQRHCLNCEYPFIGSEIFCPTCGQKDKGDQLTFGAFAKEIFNGFISWDSKIWRTCIPLLTKPGKVSKEYIAGKRARYSNPFRLYLTVSVLFFLIVGINNTYRSFQVQVPIAESNSEIAKDSLHNSFILSFNKPASASDKEATPTKKSNENGSIIGRFLDFQKENPSMSTSKALDLLGIEKSFSNQFWYSRTAVINSLFTSKDAGSKFKQQLYSYISIALFVLLPLFALFLKLLYLRKKQSYIAHLVFVFHVQTVFFLLFSILYLVHSIKESTASGIVFVCLFLSYLFIAMKTFYGQKTGKTILKFILANGFFLLLSILGMLLLSALTFALY